jgi:hypothetical protein
MIRSDRELLADLARLGRDMVAFCMRLMDDIVSPSEQRDYAQRLIAAGERLRQRANRTAEVIIEGEILTNEPLTLSERTIEPYRES